MTSGLTYTLESVIKKFNNIHENKYNYDLVQKSYKTTKSDITIICPTHGEYITTAKSHFLYGCKKCAHENNAKKGTKSQEEFLELAYKVHGNKYTYHNDFIKMSIKIKITCHEHGDFMMEPHSHINGKSACPECGKIRRNDKNRTTVEKFVENAKKIHGKKYDYSKVTQFQRKTSKVIIICPIHGDFETTPAQHITNKNGCRKCVNKRISDSKVKSYEEFLEDAYNVHGKKYDYSLVKDNWNGYRKKIPIICKEHRIFHQQPTSHIHVESDCPKCFSKSSKKEIKWLDYLNISKRQVLLKSINIIADGYDPITKTCYEFWGDYFHGNPKVFDFDEINQTVNKSFGYLYIATMRKRNKILNAGYNLIEIWESDWNKLEKEILI